MDISPNFNHTHLTYKLNVYGPFFNFFSVTIYFFCVTKTITLRFNYVKAINILE